MKSRSYDQKLHQINSGKNHHVLTFGSYLEFHPLAVDFAFGRPAVLHRDIFAAELTANRTIFSWDSVHRVDDLGLRWFVLGADSE